MESWTWGFILRESVEASSFAARELMTMGKPLISSNYSGFVEIGTTASTNESPRPFIGS
jgi:hypothetical protein